MHIKDIFKSARYLIISAFLLPVVLGAIFVPRATASTDCNNAVIYCGVSSVSGLVHKYNQGDGHNQAGSIHDIYDAFGISASDIQAMPGNARTGTVTKNGDVYVDGELVATGAMTAGRQNMDGSNRRSNGNTTFYTRSPGVSFRSDRLQALVVMQNGNFRFAILTSCGNPVIATPHHPHNNQPPKHPGHPGGISPNRPVSHHHPQQKQPPRTTTVNNNNSVCSGDTSNSNGGGVASQGGNCSANTTNNTTNTSVNTTSTTVDRAPPARPRASTPSFDEQTEAPPSEAAETDSTSTPSSETVSAAPASTMAPAALPNTGPGSILAVFGATTAVGTLAYRAYLRRQLGGLRQ